MLETRRPKAPTRSSVTPIVAPATTEVTGLARSPSHAVSRKWRTWAPTPLTPAGPP